MSAPEQRWYGSLSSWKGPRGKAQIEGSLVKRYGQRSTTLPEPVLRLAQAEYDRRFPGQPYERMQERGGLGVLEIIALLADRCERLARAADHTERNDER